MKALRVLTVDDEPLVLERVSALVRETPGLELVAEARNGLDALDKITTLEPDLVFIDVEMPELSGFGVIAALDEGKVPGVVFITAHAHYALQAFDIGAIDYVHKPVTKARFAASVERAKERLGRPAAPERRALRRAATDAERERGNRTRFVVTKGSTHYFVPASQVDWIDVADNYLRLHVEGRTHLCRGTMKEAEEELDPKAFVRVHRSAIVAIDRIVAVRRYSAGGHEIELADGARVSTSRSYADRVRALLR